MGHMHCKGGGGTEFDQQENLFTVMLDMISL